MSVNNSLLTDPLRDHQVSETARQVEEVRPVQYFSPGQALKATICFADIEEKDKERSSDMSDPRLKQLKIKTGVLKRVGKEKLSYRKEADQQKVKIEKMKEEGREEVIDLVKWKVVI